MIYKFVLGVLLVALGSFLGYSGEGIENASSFLRSFVSLTIVF